MSWVIRSGSKPGAGLYLWCEEGRKWDLQKGALRFADRSKAVRMTDRVFGCRVVRLREKGKMNLSDKRLREFIYDSAPAEKSEVEDMAKECLAWRASDDTRKMKERRCSSPPPGWYCTRERGHEGPCAAWPCRLI